MLRDLIYFLLDIEPPAEEKKPEYAFSKEERAEIAGRIKTIKFSQSFHRTGDYYKTWVNGTKEFGTGILVPAGSTVDCKRTGQALAGFMREYLAEGIQRLDSDRFLGLHFKRPAGAKRRPYNLYVPGDTISLDGNFHPMLKVLNALGFTLEIEYDFGGVQVYRFKAL